MSSSSHRRTQKLQSKTQQHLTILSWQLRSEGEAPDWRKSFQGCDTVTGKSFLNICSARKKAQLKTELKEQNTKSFYVKNFKKASVWH